MKLKARNDKFNGEIAGIVFVNGIGYVEALSEYLLEWFKEHDFEINDGTEEIETVRTKKQAKAKEE